MFIEKTNIEIRKNRLSVDLDIYSCRVNDENATCN